MFKKIIAVLIFIVAVAAGVIAMQPAAFRMSRSATMNAPAADVFAQVNDFHKWEAWSPWAKLDPNCKNTFDGPASGVGSSFAWAGNSEVGEGKMTILESKPNELIKIKLEFLKPFAATHTTEFNFKTTGEKTDEKTDVTWAMYGENNFVGKAFSLCCNMDKMIGDYYEKGLASMKKIVEEKK